MGGGTSSSANMVGHAVEVMNLLMPIYYVPNCEITLRETATCLSVWNAILDDATPNYIMTKIQPGFLYPSCKVWFYYTFYDRLFDIHPMCKPLFTRGVDSIGIFLVKMISMALGQCDDPKKFRESMVELAQRHCERGVKANEYGIMGEVLFHTLTHTAGALYTPVVDHCWKQVYSSMLRIIVPIVIQWERRGFVPAESEFETRHKPIDRSVMTIRGF
jgi:hemoglobin-like flavoprotein